MIHFVGAGPGAPDLITVRGKQYLEEADVIIYAGSLVNPQLLEYSKDVCTIYNSAKMTLEEVISVMEKAEKEGKTTVRLHTGDPCIYGDHYKDGRKNSGSVQRKHSVLCGSSGVHGDLFKHRNAGRAVKKTDRGRLSGRYSGCHCL